MKFIIVSVILVVVVTFSINGFLAMAGAKTETQKYETLYREGNFEIRFYPKANLASVNMKGSFYQNRNSGFQTLAGYIFGGNKENKKIAMTSPVRMVGNAEESKMSFIMPGVIPFEELPEPGNKNVILHQSKPAYKASVQFGGFANRWKIARKEKVLIQHLKNLNLEFKKTIEFLGYNPPYQLLNRRNEIQVELENFNPEAMLQNKD